MLHLRKCWIPWQEVQVQENPWQELTTTPWMISSEQVEPKMEQRVLARPRKDFQVGSEDWGVMCSSQDKEFVG